MRQQKFVSAFWVALRNARANAKPERTVCIDVCEQKDQEEGRIALSRM